MNKKLSRRFKAFYKTEKGQEHKNKLSQAMKRHLRRIGHNTVPQQIKKRLGKESDTTLAKECGVHHNTIRYWRWKLGIPSWRTGKPIINRPGF